MNKPIPWLALGVALSLLPACRATYPSGSAEATIAKMCEKEYHVQVQVKTHGRSIGALIVMKDFLLSDLTFSDQALNKIDNVMLTTARVALSSEYRYDFFTIAMYDPASRIQVSFVRYLKDIRRLFVDDISRNDYMQRLLIETKVIGDALAKGAPVYQLKDYNLGDFLARQIADRIRTQIQLNLVAERLFQILGFEGKYLPAEPRRPASGGVFQLIIHFSPSAPVFDTIGTAEYRQRFTQLLQETARTIIRRYEFTRFDGFEITDQDGKRLAYFDRKEFNKTSMNSLMELIRSVKGKGK